MANQKTLSTIFKAVDKFTPVAEKVAKAGKEATGNVKNMQDTLNRSVIATGFEKTASTIENAFEHTAASIENSFSGIEKATVTAAEKAEKFSTQAEKVSKKTKGLGDDADKGKKGVKGLGDEVEKTSKKTKGLGDDLDYAADKIESMDKISESLKSTIATVGAGFAATFGISAITDFVDGEMKAVNQFQSRVGANAAEMKAYKAEIADLYSNGMGESIEDTANSMATVKVNTGLIGEELRNTTNDALLLRDVFEFDVSESTRSVKMMMDQFGLSAEQSYGMIAQGAQNGLDKNGDLLDTINEYSVHFKQLGFNAEDMFNMLVNGSANGTFSVDKLGDSIKEFGIRAIDGSDSTVGAFTAIGLNADEMAKKFKAGGQTGKEAFAETISALKNMKDPIEQNTAGVSLFGTMWEDLGAKGIFALSEINGKISENSDALKKIGEVKYQDIGSAFTSLSRSLMLDFTDGFNSDANSVVEKISNMEATLSPMAESIGENVGDAIEFIGEAFEFASEHADAIKVTLSGIIGMVTAKKAVNGITNFAEGFTKILAGGPTLPLTIAAGAITAVVVGLHEYSEWAEEKSLEEHFGNITLSLSEMERMADMVIADGNLDRIRTSLEEFEKLDSAKESISEITAELDKTEWKVGLGFELTAEENEDYKRNIDSYIGQVKGYVEQQHYSATLSVNMLFGEDDSTGQGIIKKLDTYYVEREAEVAKIGTELANYVNKAYEDKVFSPEELNEIVKLKARLAEYEETVANSEFEGKLTGISGEYSYKDLTPETIDEYAGKLQEAENVRIDAQNQYRDSLLGKESLSDEDKRNISDEYNIKNAEVYARTTFEANKMINQSYADELKSGYDYWYNLDLKNPFTATSGFFERGMTDQAFSSLWMETEAQTNALRDKIGEGLSMSDRSVVTELIEKTKPEREELLLIGESYLEAGKQIPESIGMGILDNAKISALAGDQKSLYTMIGYNATRQNPEYAEWINKMIASGEDVPESIKLGVELAAPGTIAAAEKAAKETGDATKNGLDSKQGDVRNSTTNLVNTCGTTFENETPAAAEKASASGQSIGSAFYNSVEKWVQKAFGEFETIPNGGEGPRRPVQFVVDAENNATGNIYDSPTLTWVAEAGDKESIIPWNSSERSYDLWKQTGYAIAEARGEDVFSDFNENTVDPDSFSGNIFDYSPVSQSNSQSTDIITTNTRSVVIKLEGGGEIQVPNSLTREDIMNLLVNNIKPILLNIINQELYEEGDGTYDT